MQKELFINVTIIKNCKFDDIPRNDIFLCVSLQNSLFIIFMKNFSISKICYMINIMG